MSDSSLFFGGAPQKWVSGIVYAQDQVVISDVNAHLYMRITAAGSGTTDPSADATNWRLIGAGGIKSIQRGVTSLTSITGTSVDVTISAVDISKTQEVLLGFDSNKGGSPLDGDDAPKIVLTNATTLTISRITAAASSLNVSWRITESW